MGVAVVRNCRCRSRDVRTRSMVHRCSPFRLEAHRSSAPQNELSLSLRLPIYHQSLTSEEGDIPPPRVCDLPRCGAARKRNWAENGYVITTTGANVGRRYVEDHNSRFHATGSPDHGCNECCTRTDSDRQTRAKDLAQPRAPRFTRIQEIVMAKVIEFYIPKG